MDVAGWNQRHDTTELVWTAEPNRFLAAETSPLTPGTALDLGAGEGRNAVWLAQQGWQVTVVDRAERVHRSVDTADGERVAIDALVRAQRRGQR